MEKSIEKRNKKYSEIHFKREKKYKLSKIKYFFKNLLLFRERCDIISPFERPVGQAVKTSASHAENMGSIPVRVTKNNLNRFIRFRLFLFKPKGLCMASIRFANCMELPLWAYGITACRVSPSSSVLIPFNSTLCIDSIPQ